MKAASFGAAFFDKLKFPLVHKFVDHKLVYFKNNAYICTRIARIKEALLDRELIETDQDGVYLEDPVFRMWFYKR